MTWLTVAVLVLATHRLTRLIVADTLPLVAGPVFQLKRRILKRWGPAWAEGLDCPWCVSVWVSGMLVLATALTVGVPLPWLLWPAVSTAASLVSRVEGEDKER